ncbi:MAG: hypothetical protein M1837_004366 [Sclerophora amabilis]|nr:MAG: hypothetical protein M1837_004366 [Sclerophora amabilis]
MPPATVARPPPPPPPPKPRIVVYHQTHWHGDEYVSVLPLVTEFTGVTHLIVAAIHLNEGPGNITLNDDPPDAARNEQLWDELVVLQDAGITVLGMLGGAAKGSFRRLDFPAGRDDGDDDIDDAAAAVFEAYYTPLRDLIRTRQLDGLDLDVEEDMSLRGVIRLIDRLKADFGPGFLVTLAPVATALQRGRHLSGFDYEALEVLRGGHIAWYNTQFYCGWGSMALTMPYDLIVAAGWLPHKVVAGVSTNPRNAAGYVPLEILMPVLRSLHRRYPTFGGVMGWEYFQSLPGGSDRPWEWAAVMSEALHPISHGD